MSNKKKDKSATIIKTLTNKQIHPKSADQFIPLNWQKSNRNWKTSWFYISELGSGSVCSVFHRLLIWCHILSWLTVRLLHYKLTTESGCALDSCGQRSPSLCQWICTYPAVHCNLLNCAISLSLWKHPLSKCCAEIGRIFWFSSKVCSLLVHTRVMLFFHLSEATVRLLFLHWIQTFTYRCWRSSLSLTWRPVFACFVRKQKHRNSYFPKLTF